MLTEHSNQKLLNSNQIDPKSIQPCLAFLPLDTIKRTLECTTQLAKWHTCVPLQRHWKPRFPHLNVHQLMEPVATDTFFTNCKALGDDTCAQVFYGIQSRMINVYPMKMESHGPVAYEDFLREEGCPTLLRRDNSKCKPVMISQPFGNNSASRMVSLNLTTPIKILQKIKPSNGSNIMPRQF